MSNWPALSRVHELKTAVVRRTVRDVVVEKIATLIASGMLQVGDLLPSERELSAALQVSRVTVRAAIQVLEARGIIAVSHGIGSRVISADVGPVKTGLREPRLINSYDVEAVHETRLLVERYVVAEAARRISDADIAILTEALSTQSASLTSPVSFLISDREFHLTIYHACGNPVLADFVSDLYSYLMDYRRQAVSIPGAIALSVEEHRAILAALAARDPPAVVSAFEAHITRIRDTTRSILEGSPPAQKARRFRP
jgi:DNA-binding FadR family transcriptional regulator